MIVVYVYMAKIMYTAIAIAISASVTVSIGDDTNGTLSAIFFVNCELSSTSSAAKPMKPGNMMKSLNSKVSKLILIAIYNKRKKNINMEHGCAERRGDYTQARLFGTGSGILSFWASISMKTLDIVLSVRGKFEEMVSELTQYALNLNQNWCEVSP